MLLDEGFSKCRDFHTSLPSLLGRNDRPSTSRGNKYQFRGQKIMHNSELLMHDRITAETFLNRIVYKQNENDFGLLDVEMVNIIIDEEDEEIEDIGTSHQTVTPSTSQNTNRAKGPSIGTCVVCTTSEPQMVVLPCFEFCVCAACWDVIKEDNTNLKCPKCHSSATDVRKMIFCLQ